MFAFEAEVGGAGTDAARATAEDLPMAHRQWVILLLVDPVSENWLPGTMPAREARCRDWTTRSDVDRGGVLARRSTFAVDLQ